MEPNESQLSSYFHHQQHHPLHHHHHHQPPPPPLSAPSPTNGLLPSGAGAGAGAVDGGAHMVYTHSVPSSATSAAAVVAPSPLEPVKRKRGRPRKYGTPEQALAAKKAATASSHSAAAKEKKEHAGGGSSPSYSAGSSAKKSQLAALGNAGQGFTPHVISVSAGEDVAQKIMMFLQQSNREICILSASGSISNVSLRQPAASGGSVTYEGQFSIISFSGSFIRNEVGVRSGGLSVCLASTDGHIIGGGVGGPLKASGPVQVIVGSFLIDTKKDVKGDGSSGMKLPSPVGVSSPSSLGFRSGVDSGMRNPIDEQQGIAGGHFMVQPNRSIHVTTSRPTEWRPGPDARTSSAYDLTGRAGLSAHHSPENGDYDQIPD